MAGYQSLDNVALKNIASPMVFNKLVQNILHVNGRGVDEAYLEGQLGAASISIPKVALGAGAFRQLGATVNGSQFNGLDPVNAESDFITIPLLFVYDHVEILARILNDKAGYALLEQKTENIRRKIARNVNALTFAVQLATSLTASAQVSGINTISTYDPASTSDTDSAYNAFVDANAALDEGDASLGLDYFPTENRQAFFRPGFFASMKKTNGRIILNSDLGQQMLATGVLNPFRNGEASKVDMRDGYCGEIDGVPCYKVSPIIFKLAAGYCMSTTASNSTALAETAFDNIEAIVCSGIGTIRGFNSTGDIEVVPAQQGQGWVLQPLVHGGCACISPASVRIVANESFTNPATSTTSLTILPPESRSA